MTFLRAAYNGTVGRDKWHRAKDESEATLRAREVLCGANPRSGAGTESTNGCLPAKKSRCPECDALAARVMEA